MTKGQFWLALCDLSRGLALGGSIVCLIGPAFGDNGKLLALSIGVPCVALSLIGAIVLYILYRLDW